MPHGRPAVAVLVVLAGLLAGAGGAAATTGAGGAAATTGAGGAAATSAAVATAAGAPTTRAATGSAPRFTFGSDWPTYFQNAQRSGVDPSSDPVTPPSPAWTSAVLDGQLYGEPLQVDGRVFVATESDTVYALAADSGRLLWARHLGPPVPAGDLPCGDITPTVGVTGTPVIDTARHELFVVDDQLDGGVPAHHLVGIDLFTGGFEVNEVVDPPGSSTPAQLQRPGLALAGGRVVVGFGGNDGDCSTYHGWVVSVPETGGAQFRFEVDAAPGEREGAVWMGGAAPVVDGAGNIWVSVGNGSVTDPSGPYDDSDSVLELSPTLRLEQFFAPSTWASDNAHDLDLGSASPALVGDGLVFVVGKSRIAFLLRQSALGGIGHPLASMPLCGGLPDGGVSTRSGIVYVPCGDGLTAVQVHASPPSMQVLWTTSSGAHGPAIFADGLVWSIGGGTVFGLNPSTGAAVVQSPIAGGVATHFPVPTVADGLLLLPGTDQVSAYKGPDGLPGPPTPAPNSHPVPYWLAAADGGVFAFGGAPFLGSMGGRPLDARIVGMAATPDHRGYWLVAADGGVFSFGDARYHGSMAGRRLDRPIVAIVPTSSGQGYWLIASDGGVFSFGDARYHGSMGGRRLDAPVVGAAATADGAGYWLAARDGGIFAFGDARFDGSMGGRRLNAPVSAMAHPHDGKGYWLVARDGGIFAFGDARFAGSLATDLAAPIVAMAPTLDGRGYWLTGSDGGVFAFGDATFSGSMGSTALNAPVVAIAAGP